MSVIISESQFEILRRNRENQILLSENHKSAETEFREEKYLSDLAIASSVEDLKANVGNGFSKVLDARVGEFALIDEAALKGLIAEHLLARLERKGYPIASFDLSMKACFDHVRDFLFDLCLMKQRAEAVVREPYVHAWKGKGQHFEAGDAALFGYLFYYRKKGNRLSRSDYADMSVRSYYDWYGQGLSRRRHNTGKYVADRLPKFFPIIADFPVAPFRNRIRGA